MCVCVRACVCLHAILTGPKTNGTCTHLYPTIRMAIQAPEFKLSDSNSLPCRMMNCTKTLCRFFFFFFVRMCPCFVCERIWVCVMAIEERSQWENEEVSTTHCLGASGRETKQDLPNGTRAHSLQRQMTYYPPLTHTQLHKGFWWYNLLISREKNSQLSHMSKGAYHPKQCCTIRSKSVALFFFPLLCNLFIPRANMVAWVA